MVLQNYEGLVVPLRDFVECDRIHPYVLLIIANNLIEPIDSPPSNVAVGLAFVYGYDTPIRVDHEVVIKSYGCPLLIRITFENIVINELLVLIGCIRLLLLFCILGQTNVLAVGYLVLAIVGLEIVEHIFTKLQINIQWNFMHVAGVHLAEVIVNIQILVWKQPHIHHSEIRLPPLLLINLLLPPQPLHIVVSIDLLFPSPHLGIQLRSRWQGMATQDTLENIQLRSLNYFLICLGSWLSLFYRYRSRRWYGPWCWRWAFWLNCRNEKVLDQWSILSWLLSILKNKLPSISSLSFKSIPKSCKMLSNGHSIGHFLIHLILICLALIILSSILPVDIISISWHLIHSTSSSFLSRILRPIHSHTLYLYLISKCGDITR